jgi:hypothetical protein
MLNSNAESQAVHERAADRMTSGDVNPEAIDPACRFRR